jgi:hypothetical protein
MSLPRGDLLLMLKLSPFAHAMLRPPHLQTVLMKFRFQISPPLSTLVLCASDDEEEEEANRY